MKLRPLSLTHSATAIFRPFLTLPTWKKHPWHWMINIPLDGTKTIVGGGGRSTNNNLILSYLKLVSSSKFENWRICECLTVTMWAGWVHRIWEKRWHAHTETSNNIPDKFGSPISKQRWRHSCIVAFLAESISKLFEICSLYLLYLCSHPSLNKFPSHDLIRSSLLFWNIFKTTKPKVCHRDELRTG